MVATLELRQDVPALERLKAPLASHLSTVYEQYRGSIHTAMQQREREQQATTPQAKRSRTRALGTTARGAAERDDGSGAQTAAASRADGAAEGAHYLELLNSYVGLDGGPHKQPLADDYLRVELMILRNELHANALLSHEAFRVLMRLVAAFPLCKAGADSPQQVLVNPLGWSMLQKKNFADVVTMEGWQNGEGAVVPAHTAFFRLCLAAQQMVEAPADESVRQRNTGLVLLLQAVVTALQQDLAARLAALRAASSSQAPAGAADDPARPASSSVQALIMHSHLWRLLQLLPSKGISVNPSRDRLVEMLLQWIAAPASGNAQQASADQPAAASVTELGGRLLNAIMSLYAEDAGLGVGSGRLRIAADEGNDRAVIDKAIVTHLVGPKPTLLTWAQRSAVLASLHSRHRLRVLSLVAAQTRHCRPSDASKSPSMHAAHRWLAGEAEGVTAVDPLEILADFAADATVAQRFGDHRGSRGCGVTAVACGIVIAALELSDKSEERSKLQDSFEKLRIKLLEGALCEAAEAELNATHKLIAVLLVCSNRC